MEQRALFFGANRTWLGKARQTSKDMSMTENEKRLNRRRFYKAEQDEDEYITLTMTLTPIY